MYEILDYAELRDRGYTGTAYNVYYEFGLDGEWWGHSGEFADELDAWFLTRDEAIEFADECYADDVLIEKLYNSPDAGGADAIMLSIREWEWEDGVDNWDGEELFVSFRKEDGEIVLEDSYRE